MPGTVHVPPPPPSPIWSPPDPSRWGVPRIVAVVLVLLAGLGVATLRYVGEEAQFGLERLLQAAAWGALVATPAALVAMSPHRRAVLLVPAGMLLTPLAFLSLAGVLLPLLVPGVLVWVALATRWDGMPCGPVRGLLAVVVVVGLSVAGGLALLAHADPRTYGDCVVTITGEGSGSAWCPPGANGGGSTSDVVTTAEALLSIGSVSAAVVAGWVLAGPRRLRPG